MALFGAVVVGPPGSGKSTMCAGLCRYFALGQRPVALVNLDPACEGEGLTQFAIDVRDFCSVDRAMAQEGLGANGALLFCMGELERSTWLREEVAKLEVDECFPYVIFDLPGQTELFTHDGSLRRILDDLREAFDARLVAAHLVDVAHCSQPSHYVAACLLSLTAMLRLELPHINVLSKVDLADRYELALNLDFFKEAQELHRIVPFCGVRPAAPKPFDAASDRAARYNEHLQKLSGKICELVDDFGLVCYQPLDVSDGESVARLVRMLDKANGHPAGVHAPAALVEDATDLFLLHKGGRALPPWEGGNAATDAEAKLDGKARAFAENSGTRPPNRTYRTGQARDAPPDDRGDDAPAFSWHS